MTIQPPGAMPPGGPSASRSPRLTTSTVERSALRPGTRGRASHLLTVVNAALIAAVRIPVLPNGDANAERTFIFCGFASE